MANVSALIQRYIDNYIRLDQKDIIAAAKSREWLLEHIAAKINASNGPKLYKHQPFLKFGSYFKGTKVADIDEYDILVIIDSYNGQFSQNGQILGTGLGMLNPNPKYSGGYHKDDQSGISPNKMLWWLKKIVSDVVRPFGGDAPERDGQAISAHIQSKNLKIDLVPAGIFKSPQTNDIFFNIGTSDRKNGWITTLPHQDLVVIDQVSQGRDDFKNIIRICKLIKDSYSMDFSSFAIELMVTHHAVNNIWYGDLYTDLHGALLSISSVLNSGTLIDPFSLTQKNILFGVCNLTNNAETFRLIALRLEFLVDPNANDSVAFH